MRYLIRDADKPEEHTQYFYALDAPGNDAARKALEDAEVNRDLMIRFGRGANLIMLNTFTGRTVKEFQLNP